MAKPHRVAGTAALLRAMKQHRLAAATDGPAEANGLGSQSLSRRGGRASADDFGIAARTNRDIMRHGCDIAAEQGMQQTNAMVLVRARIVELARKVASGEIDWESEPAE